VTSHRSELDHLRAQLAGLAAWAEYRRQVEQLLHDPDLSREQRLDSARRIEALRRETATLDARLEQQMREPFRPGPRATAVLAHHESWVRTRLSLLLGTAGFAVVGELDNGADAVGVVVAEQPDVLVVSDPIAMLTASEVIAACRQLATSTLVAVQTSVSGREPHLTEAGAHAVFGRELPPATMLEQLLDRLQRQPA
jgi:hypothetical protein